MKAVEPDETRADVARRRLAQLAASFDSQLPVHDEDPPAPRHKSEIPYVRAVASVAVAACVLLVWWLLSARPQSSEVDDPLALTPAADASPAGPTAAAPTTDTAAELVVDVTGKVRRPGIVTLPKGSRVYQAIEAAGGLKGKVDTDTLNLAREVTDGEQILVGIAPVGGQAEVGGSTAPVRVNLNTATAEQLDGLPGVGPVTAQAILAWRDDNGRFATVDDLLDVKGIGEATLAELRDLVIV